MTFKKKIGLVILAFLLVLFNLTAAAYGEDLSELRGYLLGDYATGQVYEASWADERLEIASISKLMTYLIVMDTIEAGDLSLDQPIEIDQDTLSIGGSSYHLGLGQVYSIDQLLDMSLVVSANNASYGLAKAVAGSEKDFTKLMNLKAQELGLKNTVFYNSTGLPEEDSRENTMTAREIFHMARYALENYSDDLLERTSKRSIDSPRGPMENTNPILGLIPAVDGLKTGYTERAGQSLVASFKKSSNQGEDIRLIYVLMGAETEEIRKDLAYSLVNHGYRNYDYMEILDTREPVATVNIEGAARKNIELYPKDDFKGLVDRSREIEKKVSLDPDLRLPVFRGSSVGRLELVQGTRTIYETELVTKRLIRKPLLIKRLLKYIGLI